MKTRLTREESQHLIDLGVSKEKASENTLEARDYCPPYMNTIRDMPYPIFTLTDLLEILPKEIQDGYVYWLTIDITNDCYEVCYFAGRIVNKEIGYKSEKELIDALYQLTCWYYSEYLKSEEDEATD